MINKQNKSYKQLIEAELVKSDKLTASEISVQTGIPLLETEHTLQQLIYQYKCRLAVSADGNLIYDFGKSLALKDKLSKEEIRQKRLQEIKQYITNIGKVLLVLFLLVYSLAYVVMLIVSVFDIGKKRNKKLSLGEQFIDMLIPGMFLPSTNEYIYKTDKYGYKYKSFVNDKSFISSIFNFVFGKRRPEINILEDQKEIIAYIYQNKGIIVQSEIKALTGWTNEKSEDFFMDCLSRYRGIAKVSETGVFYGDFTEFVSGLSKPTAQISWYWDEYEPEYELTGNDIRVNFGIFAIIAPIIIYSLLIYSTKADDYPVLTLFFAVIPFIFSGLMLTIPIIRYFMLIPVMKQRIINNFKKELSLIIFTNKGNDLNINSIKKQINAKSKLGKIQIEKIMLDLIYEWGGDLMVDDNAQLIYKFPKLKNEIEEVELLRQLSVGEATNNKIVFETSKKETALRKTASEKKVSKENQRPYMSRAARIFIALAIRISITILATVILNNIDEFYTVFPLILGLPWIFASFFNKRFINRLFKIAGVWVVLYLSIIPTAYILLSLYLEPVAIGLTLLAPWVALFKAISIVEK